MPNFWEPKGPGHWAHGFLICGAAQRSDYEFHGSFPRDGKLPHISVYERGKLDRKVGRNMYVVNRHGSAGLIQRDRSRFLSLSGMSGAEMGAFLRDVWDRHLSLNPPAVQPARAQQNVPDASEFPALPTRAAAPPLIAVAPVAVAPADYDPVMQQYQALSPALQSVVRMSGLFDD